MYEKRLEEMQRNHVDECQEMKERHNDKVESLLQKLSDVNNRLAKKINLCGRLCKVLHVISKRMISSKGVWCGFSICGSYSTLRRVAEFSRII